jgi:molybdopterin converting factor small subunit
MDSTDYTPDRRVVTVRLFAAIREAIGQEYIAISCPAMVTADQLKSSLIDQYPEIAALVKRSRIAVGHAFIGDDDRLDSACDTGTTIALIPPVSGG